LIKHSYIISQIYINSSIEDIKNLDIIIVIWYNINGEKMKNIKILTFHNAENYGAALQAYALKETLKKINTNPRFVNYINEDISKDYKLIRLRSLKSFFSSLWYFPRNLKRKNNFKKFRNKYLDGNTKPYYSREDIEQDIKENDVYIAGSDQIFNPNLTSGLSDVYTLNFGKNIKKIVYGASVGNEEILEKYSNEFAEKLKDIDKISVREESIIEPLERITNKNVERVLDPTLLLDKKEWANFITENEVKKLNDKKYILVYTLFENEEITKITNYLSEKTNLKIVHFRKYNTYANQLISLYTKGPSDFVNAFKNAEYVVTNSFHGLVFSIIFERKFYAIMPKERSGRLKDLINTLGLESRMVEKEQDLYNVDLNEEINYINVKEKINEEKEKSIDYLKKGIDNV